MAWPIKTWDVGDPLPANDLNSYLRDPLNELDPNTGQPGQVLRVDGAGSAYEFAWSPWEVVSSGDVPPSGIDVAAISAEYDFLRLIANFTCDLTTNLAVRFNNLSEANYEMRWIDVNHSSIGDTGVNGRTFIEVTSEDPTADTEFLVEALIGCFGSSALHPTIQGLSNKNSTQTFFTGRYEADIVLDRVTLYSVAGATFTGKYALLGLRA